MPTNFCYEFSQKYWHFNKKFKLKTRQLVLRKYFHTTTIDEDIFFSFSKATKTVSCCYTMKIKKIYWLRWSHCYFISVSGYLLRWYSIERARKKWVAVYVFGRYIRDWKITSTIKSRTTTKIIRMTVWKQNTAKVSCSVESSKQKWEGKRRIAALRNHPTWKHKRDISPVGDGKFFRWFFG